MAQIITSRQRHPLRRLAQMVLVGGLLFPSVGAWAQTESTDTKSLSAADTQGRYQIIEATPDRVWRLDTQTGEIAVCSLESDRLICTASSEAARPSAKDYETLTQEQQAQERSEREQQLAFLDRMLEMFRELIRYALQQQNGGGEGQP